jgi:hypothetical protein
MTLNWYSAMVRILIAIDGHDTVQLCRSLFVVRCADRDSAFHAVLKRAALEETVYPNTDGETVRWLWSVDTLDLIGPVVTDGMVAFAETGNGGPAGEVQHPVRLDFSRQIQTGIANRSFNDGEIDLVRTEWYSALVNFVVVTEGEDMARVERRLFLVRADDYQGAEQALAREAERYGRDAIMDGRRTRPRPLGRDSGRA